MFFVKSLWNSFKVAFAMFSKIPVPQAEWTKENMKYMFCFFPFIGTVIGAVFLAADYLGERLSLSPIDIRIAVLLVAVPVLITGGIHVDGLLDTADALSSWQERERRLEILKDSHAGAFAVITGCVYFLLCYGAYSQIAGDKKAVLLTAAGFMVSPLFFRYRSNALPKSEKKRDCGGIFPEGGKQLR